jgi:dTDP-4-dehydrorhamnose reductase
MKLLIIGAGGQLGSKLAEKAKREGNLVYGTFRARAPLTNLDGAFPVDKTNEIQVEEVVNQVKPNAIVDTGALHNVDYCETHPDEAMAVNAEGTRNLARAARDLGAKFVFVSTDFVFDGRKRAPYAEADPPNPLSVYARSKLEGEGFALTESGGNGSVVRPAVIYSYVPVEQTGKTSSSGKPLNFAAWLVSQLSAGKEVKIVTDQVTSPTLADDLAGAILALLESEKAGLYHAAGATPLSRYDFSVKLAEKLNLDAGLIRKISSDQLKQVARRPLNSSLDSGKLAHDAGYEMMNVEHALDVFAGQAAKELTHVA